MPAGKALLVYRRALRSGFYRASAAAVEIGAFFALYRAAVVAPVGLDR
jgi:hypothetical protein